MSIILRDEQLPVYKVYIGTYGATIFDKTLASTGRRVVISRATPYFTSDKNELKELARSRDLIISNAEDQEIIRYAFKPENLPRLNTDLEKLKALAPFFKWTQADEKVLVTILEARGYQCHYIKDLAPEDYYAEQADETLIAVLNARGYSVVKRESVDLSDLTKAELLELCAAKGIEVKGRPSNATLMEMLNG